MFEPLTVCFVAPLLHSKPFKVSRLPRVAKWESDLHHLQYKDPPFCGIICKNFGTIRNVKIPSCRGAWCVGCYRQDKKDLFPVLSASDLDNFVEDEELVKEAPNRFKTACDRDHLLTSFQCDCCHFVNIHKRSPTNSTKALQGIINCERKSVSTEEHQEKGRGTRRWFSFLTFTRSFSSRGCMGNDNNSAGVNQIPWSREELRPCSVSNSL